MPKISCKKDVFFKLFGKQLTLEQLEELGFEFGIEIEEEDPSQSQAEETIKDPKIKALKKGKALAPVQEPPKLTFELAANRPDLLCIESLAHALRMYVGMEAPRKYQFLPPTQKIIVKASTKEIRPYIVGAVLRDISFDEDSYNSFIDIQDKLHQNLCRKRKLVAIGTHDLDTIQGPFIFDAQKPEEITFKALKQTQEMNCVQLFEVLEKDLYLRQYLPIIKDSPLYPVILDSNGIVLSLPPIINGEHSKMSPNTKNIFIEATATDLQRAIAALACLVSGFSQYCKNPFSIEMVEIVYEGTGQIQITPQAEERNLYTSMRYINDILGINIESKQAVKLLQKMGISSQPLEDNKLAVNIPFYRSDILQECDIAEDVGISYGYNNIEMTLNASATVGAEYRLNKMSDMVREETALSGFVECLNFVLCSIDEQTQMINRIDSDHLVRISNSKSSEFQCARASLIPPLLKTLKANAKSKLPIQLFEVSDVVLKGVKTVQEGWEEGQGQTNAVNRRRLCALMSDNDTSGLEVIHGLLDQIMLKLKVENVKGIGYHIEKSQDTTFFPGLQTAIHYKSKKIGVMGIIHPQVLENIKWDFPVSLIEIDLEDLFRDFK